MTSLAFPFTIVLEYVFFELDVKWSMIIGAGLMALGILPVFQASTKIE